ncbi:MAG: hypothetical protein RLZZ502_1761 [Pseudomonadota bacterium]|jgi:drug/metabolite transporter (DMT)-like permease
MPAKLILLIGILAVSTAAVLIKQAQAAGAASLLIAAGRMGLASLVLFPVAAFVHHHTWRTLSLPMVLRVLLCGVLLALHFAFWISSLAHTSVAVSTVLATTTPIWVALASRFLFQEHLSRGQLLGLAIALAGSLALGLNDLGPAHSTQSVWGGFLAVASAWMIAAYFLLSQKLRQALPNLAFIGLTFSTAAVVLVLLCLAQGLSLGIGAIQSEALWAIALLALVPQLIGHSALNWAIPRLGATVVTVAILGEPVGAAILALLLLHEDITAMSLLAFACILLGIYLVARKK